MPSSTVTAQLPSKDEVTCFPGELTLSSLSYKEITAPRRPGIARTGGDYSLRGKVTDRLILFIDYQNVYKGARSCFYSQLHPPHTAGQVSPLVLGQHLVRSSPYDRELAQVRVYRGRPDSTKDPKGYGACTRQVAAWERSDRVVTALRTLRYPYGWPERSGEKPQEKGIDVALAVDFVRLASRRSTTSGS
ncbi:hypothetical protein ACFYYP_36430 [Microbispora rosea]|uniref:hypothetical protein n=1 Tax=Microbispora rosea TaxID=58117 RepID=UPI0036AF2102